MNLDTHTHQARAWPQELPPLVSRVTSAPRHGQNMGGGNNCELSGGHGCPDWRERRRGGEEERGRGGEEEGERRRRRGGEEEKRRRRGGRGGN